MQYRKQNSKKWLSSYAFGRISILLGLIYLPIVAWAQRTEPIIYGDMNQWIVRQITESKLLGGNTKTLYTLGASDTIKGNSAYKAATNNPWGCSDTYARFMGVETATSGSVYPEKRGNGYCCRLRNVLTHISLVDMYAMVSGTIYMGHALEPLGITAKSKPYSAIDFGVPFTKHPIALMLDYKASISNSNVIISTKHNKIEKENGHDCAVVYAYLQYRWEDKSTGKIYARRVGTAYERICQTIPEWVNNHQIPIRWGNITNDKDFKDYEGLNRVKMMTKNSKGNMVEIEEVGWSLDEPTHIVLYISSSNAGVFRACEGNTLWVDNLKLVYKE
jgi:hypothetical protein